MSNAESSESSTKPGSSEPSQNADLGEGASSSSLLHKLVIARGRGRAACLIAVAVTVAATVFFLGARHRKGLIRIVASPSHFPWIVVGGCALLIFLIWLVPKCQVRRLRGLAAEDRFDRENEARKTLAQIIGGLLVIGGILLSINTLLLQQGIGSQWNCGDQSGGATGRNLRVGTDCSRLTKRPLDDHGGSHSLCPHEFPGL